MFKSFLLSISCLFFAINSFASLNPAAIKETKKYHFQSQQHSHKKNSKLKQEYSHTQIFKLNGTTDQTNCDDLSTYIVDEIFSDLFKHDFYYSAFLVCYVGENNIEYGFNGLFEPSDEDATRVAKKMLAELEGKEIYGSTLHFYEAKAIIYNLLMTIGRNPNEDENVEDDFYYNVQSTSLREHSLQEAYDTTFADIDKFEPADTQAFLSLTSKFFGELSRPAIEEALRKGNSVRLIALPMFLYGDDLSVYKDIIGGYIIREFY